MKRDGLLKKTNSGHILGFALIIVVFLGSSTTTYADGRAKSGNGSTTAQTVSSTAHVGESYDLQPLDSRRALDATPWLFVRLVAVLCAGLIISAARLAHKFRRFWGLGVFTNPYAVLFLAFGTGLCGLPATSEGALRLLPNMRLLGPWVADLSGIILVLVLSAIRVKAQPLERENHIRDFAGASSSNPILAVIEEATRIREGELFSIVVFTARGESDDRKLDYDGAIANYQEALHGEPNDDGCFYELCQALAEAQRSLGWALSDKGRFGEAVGWFQRANRLDPDLSANPAGQYYLALALAADGKPEEAAQHFALAKSTPVIPRDQGLRLSPRPF